jgi:hypothetical protein
VYYLAQEDVTIPVPKHAGDVPVGTLRAIIREMGSSVDEFNDLQTPPGLRKPLHGILPSVFRFLTSEFA